MSDQKSMTRQDESSSTSSSASSADQSLAPSGDASQIPQALKGLAEGVVDEAKKAAESQIANQKNKVADSLGGVAHALRQATSARHEPVIDTVRPYVDKAADQVERVSSYVQDRSLRDMASDLESFARREPALFLGGAFLAGLVGGRFLKAGTPQVASLQGNGSSSWQAPNGNRQVGNGSASAAGGNQNGHSPAESAKATDKTHNNGEGSSNKVSSEPKKDFGLAAAVPADRSENKNSKNTSPSQGDKFGSSQSSQGGKHGKSSGQS
jgi:hypothetical protein